MNLSVTRFIAIIILICAFVFSTYSHAYTCKPEIRRNNIIANAVFTTLFRSINGELKTWSDAGESLFYGGSAGYLFYKSRVLIGDGHENIGMATAYLASSITENTTFGEHPLAYLRAGLGPFDFRMSTRWARNQETQLSIGINSLDAIGLIGAIVTGEADDFKLRNTVMAGTDQGIIEGDFDGYTIGRTVITKETAKHDNALWRHELIHATQHLQFSSFGSLGYNPFDFDKFTNYKNQPSGLSMHVRIEWFNAIVNNMDQNRDYEDRWMEIEASRIAQDTSPLHNPNDNNCSSQVGFQFQF